MIHRVSIATLVVVVAGSALPAAGQIPTNAGVSGVRSAYEQLDFDLALSRADSIIQSSERYSPAEMVEVHTIAALVHLARNQAQVARRHFLSALSIDPALELDPVIASPRAIELFRSARDEVRAREAAPDATLIRYLRVYDPRPAAAFRSMVVPGWGQIYKGQRSRGYIMMGLWGITAAGTIAAHVVRHDRRQSYLEETDPARIEDRYDAFDRWHKARNNLALAAAATWVVSYLDALVFGGFGDAANRPALGLSYTRSADPSGPSLSIRIPLR